MYCPPLIISQKYELFQIHYHGFIFLLLLDRKLAIPLFLDSRKIPPLHFTPSNCTISKKKKKKTKHPYLFQYKLSYRNEIGTYHHGLLSISG